MHVDIEPILTGHRPARRAKHGATLVSIHLPIPHTFVPSHPPFPTPNLDPTLRSLHAPIGCPKGSWRPLAPDGMDRSVALGVAVLALLSFSSPAQAAWVLNAGAEVRASNAQHGFLTAQNNAAQALIQLDGNLVSDGEMPARANHFCNLSAIAWYSIKYWADGWVVWGFAAI